MRVTKMSTLAGTLLLSLYACAEQQTPTTAGLTRADFAGQSVRLSDNQGRCMLSRTGNATLTLDMKWPCRFSEDQQQKLRVENFRQAQIIMVERSDRLPAPSQDCETDLQAVRLYNGKLEASPVSRVTACGPGYWDQKVMTWQFDW